MDLREKPGKVQTLLELLMRFRLIAVVAMVIATVSFVATNWQEMVSFSLASSEAFGMWLAEIENVQGVWDSARFISVAGLAGVVIFTVFGGIRGGIAALVSAGLSAGALYLLGGSETMPLPMFGVLTLVALILILFAKFSVACGLFPFVLSWLFLCGLFAAIPQMLEPSWLLWAVLSAFGFASAMALSVVAGSLHGAGAPPTGALVKAAKQMLSPVLIGSLLLIAAIAFDMPADVVESAAEAGEASAENASVSANIPGALLYFAVFNVWFFAFLFPTMSFAPWERLRAGSRRVEMKDKKKNTGKSKKKK